MTRRSLITVLFACLFIGGTNHILNSAKETTLTESEFWENKVTQERIFDYVIVGDSRVYRGFAASLLENAFNFGFSSTTLTPEYLDKAVQLLSDNSIKNIIIGITPHSLSGPYEIYNAHQKRLEKKYKNRANLTHIESINKNILSSDSLVPNPTNDLLLFFQGKKKAEISYTHFKDGFVGTNTKVIDHTQSFKSYRKTFSKVQFSSTLFENLKKKIASLRKQGYMVYFYFPPTPKEMIEIEKKLGKFDFQIVRDDLTKLGATYIAVDQDYISYDGSHITEAAARKLTKDITDQL